MLRENSIINGTYKIIRPIGKGGVGVIYLAEHLHLRKKVVLKKIKSTLGNTAAVRQEADILKSLHHMYLPQVYDFFWYDSQVFTVIDYIEGRDLQHYIDDGAVFAEEQLVKWMLQLCDALDYLHSHNPPVYHNDIKPANIIVNSDGNICLIDFNISTEAADLIYGFTAEYASPEQYYKVLSVTDPAYAGYSPQVGARSDLYSLGATFYRLASGRPTSVYAAVSGEQPLFSRLGTGRSDGFCAIIDTLTAPDPERRYRSAQELKRALSALDREDLRFRRYWTMRVLTLLLSGLIVVAGIWCVYRGRTLMKIEDFNASYAELCGAYEDELYEQTVDAGAEILGKNEWESVIGDAKTAKINYIIGMSYFKQGRYDAAEQYLKTAIDTESDPAVRCGYEMDMSIVYAYGGNIVDALDMLKSASDDGLDESRAHLANAQLCYTLGRYDETITFYKAAVGTADVSRDTFLRACELAGDAYTAKGDYANAVAAYTQTFEVQPGMTAARKLGEACSAYSQSVKLTTEEESSLLEKARQCYEYLCESDRRTAVDMINCGSVYRRLGELKSENEAAGYFSASEEILKTAAEEYADDPRIYLQLALTYDKLGEKESSAESCLAAQSLAESNDILTSGDRKLLNELKSKYGL